MRQTFLVLVWAFVAGFPGCGGSEDNSGSGGGGGEDGEGGDGGEGDEPQPICARGETTFCNCPGIGSGSQTCSRDRMGWDACACKACMPGEVKSCFTCGGGDIGSQTCTADGEGYGACECPEGGGGGGCADHFGCGDGEICVAGACDGMYGRPYRVMVLSATIAERAESGETWDPFGGLPDPYVIVAVGEETAGTSASVQDNREPTWNFSAEVTLFQSDPLRFFVYDEDYGEDDFVSGVGWDDTSALIKLGGTSGGVAGSVLLDLTITIEPK